MRTVLCLCTLALLLLDARLCMIGCTNLILSYWICVCTTLSYRPCSGTLICSMHDRHFACSHASHQLTVYFWLKCRPALEWRTEPRHIYLLVFGNILLDARSVPSASYRKTFPPFFSSLLLSFFAVRVWPARRLGRLIRSTDTRVYHLTCIR